MLIFRISRIVRTYRFQLNVHFIKKGVLQWLCKLLEYYRNIPFLPNRASGFTADATGASTAGFNAMILGTISCEFIDCLKRRAPLVAEISVILSATVWRYVYQLVYCNYNLYVDYSGKSVTNNVRLTIVGNH